MKSRIDAKVSELDISWKKGQMLSQGHHNVDDCLTQYTKLQCRWLLVYKEDDDF